MLSSVLNSDRAVQMNILIMRALCHNARTPGHPQNTGSQNRKAGHRDHAIAIDLLAKDIQALGQKVMNESK
jgi:hypothetical protein